MVKKFDASLIKSNKNLIKIKGNIGEELAINYMIKNSYTIINRNFKCFIGEIDMIAKDQDDVLIFVEVKARGTAKFGYPRVAVTPEKQRKIRRTAEFYLKVNKLYNTRVRFDVIEILAGEITHLKNAF